MEKKTAKCESDTLSIYDDETIARAIGDYLLNGKSTKSIAEDIEKEMGKRPNRKTVSEWSKKERYLQMVSERRGYSVEYLKRKRKQKVRRNRSFHDDKTKAKAVEDYLLTDKIAKNIAEDIEKETGQRLNHILLYRWSKKERYLQMVSERRGYSVEYLKEKRKQKVGKYNDKIIARAVQDYILTDKSPENIAEDIGKKTGKRPHKTSVSNWSKKERYLKMVSERRGYSVEYLTRKRKEKVQEIQPLYDDETKARAVHDYILTDKSPKDIAEDIKKETGQMPPRVTINKWLKKERYLRIVSERTNYSIEELKRKREEKVQEIQPLYDDETKARAVEDYLLTDKNLKSIAEDIEKETGKRPHKTSVSNWSKKERYLQMVSERTRLSIEKLILMREKRSKGTNNKLQSYEELLEVSPDSERLLDDYQRASRYAIDTESRQMAESVAKQIYESLNGQKSRTSPKALERMVYTMPRMNLGVIRLNESNGSGFKDTAEAIEQSLAALHIEPGMGVKILSRYHMGVMERMGSPRQARRYLKRLEADLYG